MRSLTYPLKKCLLSVIYLFIFSIFIPDLISNMIPGIKSSVWAGFKPNENDLQVALVGPMTGKDQSKGEEMVRGARLYLDWLNSKGGINGRRIFLQIYDDQNDISQAKNRAIEISSNPKILFVLGHYDDDTSIAASKIYYQKKIPAITATSTADDKTAEHDYFFRIIFNNDLQGKIIACYSNQILKHHIASIIHDEDAYGSSLGKAFEIASNKLNLTINYKWSFNRNQANFSARLNQIIDELLQKKNAGIVFLAIHEKEAVSLIKTLRDRGGNLPLIGGNALGHKSFLAMFNQFPMERSNPGFYTDDLYAASNLIMDTADYFTDKVRNEYVKKYNEDPGATVLSYYDAMALGCKAIEQILTIEGVLPDREKIRKYLTEINSLRNAFRGTTGSFYFDADGNALKAIPIGLYKSGHLISAPVQLTPMTNIRQIDVIQSKNALYGKDLLKKDQIDPDIFLINDIFFQKVNLVYTGIEIKEINNLNLNSLLFDMDFYLWFRYQEGTNPEQITFLNASKPVMLEKPVDEKHYGQTIYRKYQLRGSFKADFLTNPPVFGEHVLGMSFRHNNLNQKQLVYIVDVLGMGISNKSDAAYRNISFLSPVTRWEVNRINIYRDTLNTNSMGEPEYLSTDKGQVTYSRFNLGIVVQKTGFSLKKIIQNGTLNYLIICISLSMVFLAISIGRDRRWGKLNSLILLCQFFFTIVFMVSFEIALLDVLRDHFKAYYLNITCIVFDMAWWMILAFFLNKAIMNLIWIPIQKKTQQSLPSLIIYFINFIIYAGAIFAIIAFVFDEKLLSLLIASATLAVIVGLAVQMNISNIFSGISLNIERPFRIGDYVKIGDFEEGQVVNVTWRCTIIKTDIGSIISIPNRQVSESVINNFSYPDDLYRGKNIIHIDPIHPPDFVKKILSDAVLSVNAGIEHEFLPEVLFIEIDAWSAVYQVTWSSKNYRDRFAVKQEVEKRIWTHLKRAGIKHAMQRHDLHLFEGIRDRGNVEAVKPFALIDEIELFKSLSEFSKKCLSEKMFLKSFSAGDYIVKQNDSGDSLFIVVEGSLKVMKHKGEGDAIEVGRLGSGDIFGEMALLTGEPRSAHIIALTGTTLYEIKKSDIAPFLREQPQVTHLISEILTLRKMKNESLTMTKKEQDIIEQSILQKIQQYFNLSWIGKP